MKYSKLIVALVILLNVAFTASVLVIFYRTGLEPQATIAAWFAFTTGELWLLSKIERDKQKKGGKSHE